MEIKRIYNLYDRLIKIALIGLILLVVFGYCTSQIGDGDFWWHLKQGEWMVKNHSLLQSDPFAYTSPYITDREGILRERFNLTQYWLSDVIFYLAYSMSGIKGNIILRASIYTLMVFFVFLRMRRVRVNYYVACGMSVFMSYLSVIYLGERPQIVSFLAASVLMFLIEDFRERLRSGQRYTHSIIAIPLLMVLWANLHGGFIVGILILIILLVSEILKVAIKKHKDVEQGHTYEGRTSKVFVFVLLLSVALSFVNPNTYKVIPFTLNIGSSIFVETIDEYFSAIKFMKYVSPVPLVIILSLTVLNVAGVLRIRKAELPDVFLFMVLGVAAFRSVRLLMFFCIVAVPVIGSYLSYEWGKIHSIIERRGFLWIFKTMRLAEIAIAAFLLHVFITNAKEGVFFRFGVSDKEIFPAGAVRFIKDNHPAPNMFNNLLSGGYLIWELYPGYQVYMDGRTFSRRDYMEHDRVFRADAGSDGEFGWKEILGRFRVNFILTFSLEPHTGRLYGIIPVLLGGNDWRLVYMDDFSLLFMRNADENREFIKKFGIPNEFGWNEVVMEAYRGIGRHPHNVQYYLTMGDALFAKHDYRGALEVYEKAAGIHPGNRLAAERLLLIRKFVRE